MEFNSTTIGFAAIAVIILVAWTIIKFQWLDRRLAETQKECVRLRDETEKQAEQLKKEKLLEAKDQILTLKSQAEEESQAKRRKMDRLERQIEGQRDEFIRQQANLERKEREFQRQLISLTDREQSLAQSEQELRELKTEQLRRLEAVAGLTAEEAKRRLIGSLEQDARRDAALSAKKIEEEAKQLAQREARKLVTMAIQRCAAEHVVESTVSVVDLPTDDMKGRIIGREGRNIRALEQATGVDLIVDDTPEAVILSGFDPLRRQIAKLAIESLIKDGRIHPARIEEVVSKVKLEMEQNLFEEGEQIAFELGIHDMAPELLRLMEDSSIAVAMVRMCFITAARSLTWRDSWHANWVPMCKSAFEPASCMISEICRPGARGDPPATRRRAGQEAQGESRSHPCHRSSPF